jgi:hypothetical protein
MTVENDDTSQFVRSITDAEIAHYQVHGWAKLEKLYSPMAIEGLLNRAKVQMGHIPTTVSRVDPCQKTLDEYRWYARWDGCSHYDDWIRTVSHSHGLASAASQLMGGPVRFYFDHIFVKKPTELFGSATPWHQDLPHHPLDRHGVLTIWAPLVDCPPEMGSMRFLNGSHRAGLLGRYLNRSDGISLVDENPWVLDEYELSPPLHLFSGDATVHNLAIIHYAPENLTGDPRWVYVTQWLPSSARYTGAPNHRTDGLNLQIDRPFDHPRFPAFST